MKKLIKLLSLLLMLFLLSTFSSCEKEELQPGWHLWKKNYVVLTQLNETHKQNENHIKLGRTTTESYNWGDAVVVLNGPAGFSPLYNKATNEFGKTYQNEVMPDTTELCMGCMQEKIIKKFLELKWENTANDAFKKMRLAVPKDLYEVYPRFFEMFLTAQMSYLTGQIGGNPDWYGGTRSIEHEKEIALLFYKDDTDFQDPWECNCSPYTYVLDYYKNYVPGNNKNLVENLIAIEEQRLEQIIIVQQDFSSQRFATFASKYGGSAEDYKTQYDSEEGIYYLEIPAY